MEKNTLMLFAFFVVLSFAVFCGGVGRPTMSLEEYKAVCVQVDYDTLARNTDSFRNTYISVSGKVFQVVDNGSYYVYMLDMSTGFEFSQHVFVTMPKGNGPTILENDHVTIYGQGAGTQTDTTVLGAQRTIRKVQGAYVTLSVA